MDKELVRSKVEEIKGLHQEVLGSVKMTLDKVVKIGRLLSECKEQVGYGMWMTWVEANHELLGFGYKTANNYINCFERKDDPRFLTVRNLSDIYYPQLEHKPEKKESKPKEPEKIADEWDPNTGKPTHYEAPVVEEAQLVEDKEDEKDDKWLDEPSEDNQDDMLEGIKDNFLKLDRIHKNLFIDWLEELLEQKEAA